MALLIAAPCRVWSSPSVELLPGMGLRITNGGHAPPQDLLVSGLRRTGGTMLPWACQEATQDGSSLIHKGAHMEVRYQRVPQGVRQDFLVPTRSSGYGHLEVVLAYPRNGHPTLVGPGDVHFYTEQGEHLFSYTGLTVTDACGDRLPARMWVDRTRRSLVLSVDDRGATYPVLVDPVATTHNTLITGSQNGARFGKAVATAGDLNGDGFSDVVVGARDHTNGQNLEGAAFVFYGSASGIGTVADVQLEVDQANASFGNSVSTAGDINGDGYSDLIVGAPNWETDGATLSAEGGIFIYYGSATGIATVPDEIRRSNSAAKYMGWSVACAGDIDNDGFSDIVTGGWLAAYGQFNEGAVWVYKGGASGLAATAVHRLERNQSAAQFGATVAGAGDVNGDGYSDIIVGAHAFDFNVANDGATFIYHGGPTNLGAGLNPAPALSFTAPAGSVRSGWSVASAGDVNGDGYSDIITGHYLANIGGPTEEGIASIHHGSPTGIDPVPATILQGGQASAWFGRSVSGAGDMNGDGYADVVVGAVTFSAGQSLEGAAFVYLGSATGVATTHHRRFELNQGGANVGESVSVAGDVNGDGFSDVIVGSENYGGSLVGAASIYHGGTEVASQTASLAWSYGQSAAHAGSSLAHAGDVNGDGYGDLLVGAPDASDGQAAEGLAYLHYGSTSGINATPDLTLQIDLAGAHHGACVATAGDVNGDGYADVVVGAPQANGTGRATVYHGASGGLSTSPAWTLNGTGGSELGLSVMTAGDVNSDGYADLIVAAPAADEVRVFLGTAAGLEAVPHISFTPPAVGIRFGQAVSTAGDVNGDGYSDVLIGAPLFTNGQNEEGAVFIYHGSDSGLVDSPARILEGALADAHFGISVAGIGDANGDGYDEVAIGSDLYSAGQINEGRVAVFRGSPSGVTTALNNFYANSDLARLGFSVAEAGDVNGDGYADLIAGAPYFTSTLSDQGRVWLWHGSPTGLNTPRLLTGPDAGALFGWSVAGAGDLDGDGYSDVVIGEPNANGAGSEEGRIHWHRGNDARSIDRLTRQYLADLVSPLSTNSLDMVNSGVFGVGHRTRSHIQRSDARLCWEVVTEGQPFAGSPITNSVLTTGCGATFTDLVAAGLELKELVAKTPGYIRYKWRLRPEYALNKLIDGQRFGRWFYGSVSGTGDIGILPVELLRLSAQAERQGNRVEWSTASESNSAHFIVQRSTDAERFIDIGMTAAAGQSNVPLDYDLLDREAPDDLSYYRLLLVDRDGSTEPSPIVAVRRSTKQLVLYPDPAVDVVRWTGPPAARVEVMDVLGHVVMRRSPAGTDLPIATLPAGSYTLSLYDSAGNRMGLGRFVKAAYAH
ncbi:MAG: FG-GAP-like repeat-containing protein [Flavobacteriales bacterium]